MFQYIYFTIRLYIILCMIQQRLFYVDRTLIIGWSNLRQNTGKNLRVFYVDDTYRRKSDQPINIIEV